MDKNRRIDRILIITTSYPDGMPGSEAAGSFVEDFAVELSNYVNVCVVAASKSNTQTCQNNMSIRRFGVPKSPVSLLNPKLPYHWPLILVTLLRGYREVGLAIKQHRPDHIFALWALPCGYWANRLSNKYGMSYSIWALGSDIWNLGRIPLIRTFLKRVLNAADRCYADGYGLKKQVEEIGLRSCLFLPSTRKLSPVPRKKMSSEPPYKLAFLGRWHPNKGVDLLLDSLSLLGDDDWKKIAEIRINGGGPLYSEVQKKVACLQEMGRPVSLGGYLGKAQAADLIAWADYLLLPSRVESIPVIFSDAVKVSTPIISTPVGDLPNLFNRYKVGVMAEKTNKESYVSAICLALNQQPTIYTTGLLEASREFDLSKVVSNFLQVTETLLADSLSVNR